MLEIYAKVDEKGKLPPHLSDKIRNYLNKNSGSFLHIYMDKKRKQKSRNQRGYYWACVLPLIFNFSQGTNVEFESLQQVHEVMKRKFLTIVPQKNDGTLMEEKVLSTESLNAKETEDYYEQIRRFWATKGLYIPLPNEYEEVSVELV